MRLEQLLHYLLLYFGTWNLFAQVGGGKSLSHFPLYSGKQTKKGLDDVGLKYNAMFNDSAIRNKNPLNVHKLKIHNIKDKHYHIPVFAKDSYRTSILETSQLNTIILKVEAKDTHTSLIKYSLLGPGNEYFHMNPLNGVITLVKVLEYNRIHRYNLSAQAVDSVGLTSMVPVFIDIQDVDTMNPHFIFPLYEGSFSENQRGILSTHPEEIKAIDGDLGINESLYYSISNVYPREYRNGISINRNNGTISLTKEIDREIISLLRVEIKATQEDNDLKSADAVVMITILDENDNAPQFSQSIYEAFFPENSPPGSVVLVLSAIDKDKDGLSNGHFRTNNTMFTVNNSGMMSFINGKLDRELTSRIYIQVWVFDAVSGGLNSSAEVIINITDINDNNPQFHNLPLHYVVQEGDYTDTSPILVATLNVTDLDAGLNGNVIITGEAEGRDKSFKVQKNGNIFVNGSLDREKKDKYVMFLIASDKGTPPRQNFADAEIVIEDVNDNAPTFTKEEYSVELNLNKVKAGDTIMSVSATDLDIGNNSLISYRFAQPHPGFDINKENGDIFLTSIVSAKSMKTNIVIPVIATDHGIPALSSTATVTIKVSEGQTKFANSNYSFSLLEGMPEGSDVGSVEIIAGPDVSVMYFVKTYADVFSITEKGTIITRTILDREEQDSYNILVMTVDSQDPPNTAVAVVTITVMDVNDNAPIFSPLIKTNVTCLENKNFLNLDNITATDLDTGDNSVIRYSLENDFNGTFHINSVTGKLMNIKPLDAEKTDSYDLNIIARDSGIPPLSSTTMIHVTVQDVDDNSPIFKRKIYNITAKENEPPHVILNVSAVDIDNGPNAVILYSFTEISHLFYIGEESGSISNLQPLDYEARREHVLTLIAYNPKKTHPESTATVIVTVEDVNEEGPTVEHPVYHTVMWDGEFATGNIIFDVNAKKANKNMDEGIHYSISGDNSEELFSIANGTGHIYITKDLPMHSFPEYNDFTVTCTDSGVPPQSTSVKVFVVISPRNITVPVFSANYYKAEPLNTWTAPHTYVIQIKAFYLHSSLKYSIKDEKNEDYFVMDAMSGIMRTKKFLKMEDFPRNVTVKATDSKQPSIYSEAIIHVTVISGNQYAPVFTSSLEKVSVKEEQKVPTFVAQVQATDKDPGRNGILTYSILNNHSTSFTIDATNGKVFALITFDYENGPHEFQVFICVEDDGMPHKKQSYLTLIVKVLDINDCKPVFSPYGSMYVEENAPVGKVVGKITATDEDSGDNALIVYSLLDDDDQFDIDKLLGNIFIKHHLDHEKKKKSTLIVTARNNMTAPFYQTRTNITVYILDENDNPPQFTQKIYFSEIDVNSPVDSIVVAVNATDRDEGNNGVVEYSLLPSLSSNYFLFENIRNGKIITATNHLKPGKVNLSVIGKDKGSPSLSNMATVIVNLIKKMETLPAFIPNKLSTVLRKNKPKEEPVFTFSAKNASGKDVMYRIVAGNDKGHFYLDGKTGKLWTTEKFAYDIQPSYNITVEVDKTPDTQGPLSFNMARLQIIVQDVNEGPMFEKETYASTIVNTVPPGFPVIKVTARSRKPTLIYSLVNQIGGEFDINNHTGQIVAAKVAGKTGTFRFKAKVTDKNGLSAQTEVQIKVESPPSSHDVEKIKINQTSHDVKMHFKDIVRALEHILHNKVKNISLESEDSDKQNTEIKFEVPGETKEDLVRKLTENLPEIEKQLSSIFAKPIEIAIPQPPKFALSNQAIAGIGTFVALVVALIVAAAIFLTRKPSQQDSTGESSEFTGNIDSASGVDKPSNNVLYKDNGDEKPNIDADQSGVSNLPGSHGENDDGRINGEENKSAKEGHKEPAEQPVTPTQEQTEQDRDKEPNIDHPREVSKLPGTCESETHEATAGDEHKSTTEGHKEPPQQQMDQTVTPTQEQTEQDSTSNADKKLPEQKIDETVDKDSTVPTDMETPGVELSETVTLEPCDENSTVPTDTPSVEISETVTLEPCDENSNVPTDGEISETMTYTVEPADGNSTVPADGEIIETVKYALEPAGGNSEQAQSIQQDVTVPEEDIKEEGQKPKIEEGEGEEEQVEYVEAWESYESSEDSDMESKKEDPKQEIPESPNVPIQPSRQRRSALAEKTTVKFLDEE